MLCGVITQSNLVLFGNVLESDLKDWPNNINYEWNLTHYIGSLVNSDASISSVNILPIDKFFVAPSNNPFEEIVEISREEALEWFCEILPKSRKNMR